MSANHRNLDESDIKLIACVKNCPTLYDTSIPDFRLTLKKDHEWTAVSKKLGISCSEAKRRWTCLRDKYSRELKQLRLHPEPDKCEYGQNEFFKTMDFLRNFVRKRNVRRRSNRGTSAKCKRESNSWESFSINEESMNIKRRTSSDMDDNLETEEHAAEDDNCMVSMEETNQNFEHSVAGAYMHKLHTNHVSNMAEDNEEYDDYVDDTYEEYDDHKLEDSKPTNIQSNSMMVVLPSTYTITSANAAAATVPYQHQSLQRGLCKSNLNLDSVSPSLPAATAGISLQTQPKLENMTVMDASSSGASTYSNAVAATTSNTTETEDDFFCKSIAAYLRQLSRRHKIKAKVEMFQILEKYIEMEENSLVYKASKNV